MRRILILAFLAAMAVSAFCSGCGGTSGSVLTPTPNSIPVAIEGMDVGTIDGTTDVLTSSRFKYAFEDVNTSTVTTSTFFMVKATDSTPTPICDAKNALSATVSCQEWGDYTICVLEPAAALDCGSTYHICMTGGIKKSDGTAVFPDGLDRTFYTVPCDWSATYGGTACITWDGVSSLQSGDLINYAQFVNQINYAGWTDEAMDCVLSYIYKYYGALEGCIDYGYLNEATSSCGLPQLTSALGCVVDSDCTVQNSNWVCVGSQCVFPDCGSRFTTDCSEFDGNESACDDAFSYDRDYNAHFRRCVWSAGTCATQHSNESNYYECFYNASNDRSNTTEGGGYACDFNAGTQYSCETIFNGKDANGAACSSAGVAYDLDDMKARMTHIDTTAGKNRAIACASHFATAADVGCFSEETYWNANVDCKIFDDSSAALCHSLYDATYYNGGTPESEYCHDTAYPYRLDSQKCREAYYYDNKGNKYNCSWSEESGLNTEPPIYGPHCWNTNDQCSH